MLGYQFDSLNPTFMSASLWQPQDLAIPLRSTSSAKLWMTCAVAFYFWYITAGPKATHVGGQHFVVKMHYVIPILLGRIVNCMSVQSPSVSKKKRWHSPPTGQKEWPHSSRRLLSSRHTSLPKEKRVFVSVLVFWWVKIEWKTKK